MLKYADVKIGYACNDDCVHCVVDELRRKFLDQKQKRTTKDYFNEIHEAKKRGCNAVILTGGEPTINKDFFEILKFIKSQEMIIHIQSNGRYFSDPNFADKACEYIESFEIALHGPNEKIHDYITRTKGSFRQTVEGIKNIIELKGNQKLYGKIVLSKINYKYISKTLILYKKLGVKYVTVAFPHSNGADDYIKTVAPRYFEIRKYLEEALDNIDPKKLLISLENILPCLLDKEYPIIHYQDFYQVFKKSDLKLVGSDFWDWNKMRKSIREKSPKCNQCLFGRWCEGIWNEYVDEYGFDEINPITKIHDFENIKFKKIENE